MILYFHFTYNFYSRSSSHKSGKKRRRIATPQQRRAANIRERRRMFNLNEAFDRLRTKVTLLFFKVM